MLANQERRIVQPPPIRLQLISKPNTLTSLASIVGYSERHIILAVDEKRRQLRIGPVTRTNLTWLTLIYLSETPYFRPQQIKGHRLCYVGYTCLFGIKSNQYM